MDIQDLLKESIGDLKKYRLHIIALAAGVFILSLLLSLCSSTRDESKKRDALPDLPASLEKEAPVSDIITQIKLPLEESALPEMAPNSFLGRRSGQNAYILPKKDYELKEDDLFKSHAPPAAAPAAPVDDAGTFPADTEAKNADEYEEAFIFQPGRTPERREYQHE